MSTYELKEIIEIKTDDLDIFYLPEEPPRVSFFSLFCPSWVSDLFTKKREILNSKQNLHEAFKLENEKEPHDETKEDVKNWKLEDFEKLEEIGNGSFGKVFKCQNKKTKKFYALKELKKRLIIDLKLVQYALNEKMHQMELSCPFIVKLYSTFQDEKRLYMLMEYVVGGELFSWMKKNQKFSNNVFFIY